MKFKFFLLIILLFSASYLFFNRSITYAANASFSFSPVSGSFAVGDVFDIKVLINTAGTAVLGADIYFNYPADTISLVSITEGNIFDQYIGKEIDNNAGSASLSGIKNSTPYYSGSDTFATLRFKALKQGTANVDFKFTLGKTTDTNIVEGEKDILTQVTNGSYTISSGAGKGGVGEGTPTPTIPVTSGSLSFSLLLISSILLFGLGFIFFRFSLKKTSS